MSDVHVATDELHNYANSLEQLGSKFDSIRSYMEQTACDKSGFTGLLTLLQPGVDLVQSLFNDTLKFGQDRMNATVKAVHATAEHYNANEQKISGVLNNVLNEMESGGHAASHAVNTAENTANHYAPGSVNAARTFISHHVGGGQGAGS
jgi:hypothetical protein